MNKTKIIASVALIVVLASIWVFWLKGIMLGNQKTITLHRTGFYPKRMTVHLSETVTFRTTTGKPFWPASNVHPIHELYPEFDPQKPVAPGTSWQFTFTREGKWRFHDHIYPEFRGTILVLAPGESAPKPLDCTAQADIETKRRCWEERLSDALESRGLPAAFVEFSKLYQSDPEFVTSGCHVHAHRIGDEFYQVYASKLRTLEGIELPPETMACGYGFFHGLFEHFFRKHPDVQLARTICDDLDRRYSASIPLIRINCFHGAGHGLIADPPDPSLWGNPAQLIKDPLLLCAQISDVEDETHACMDGIFNIVSSWMGDAKYGMTVDSANPFWLCKTLTGAAEESCYYEQIMVMSEMENRNFLAITTKYVAPISNRSIAKTVMFSLAASFMQRDVALPTHAHMLLNCRNVPRDLSQSCLEGVLNGFKGHGEPGMEYKKAVAFCGLGSLTPHEQEICYPYLTKVLWDLYPEKKIRTICGEFSSQYRQQCETGQGGI